MNKPKTITVELDGELKNRFKHVCTDLNITLKNGVSDSIKDYVEKHEKKLKRKKKK